MYCCLVLLMAVYQKQAGHLYSVILSLIHCWSAAVWHMLTELHVHPEMECLPLLPSHGCSLHFLQYSFWIPFHCPGWLVTNWIELSNIHYIILERRLLEVCVEQKISRIPLSINRTWPLHGPCSIYYVGSIIKFAECGMGFMRTTLLMHVMLFGLVATTSYAVLDNFISS